MPEHDPLGFATGLSAKLATRSRHVCMFLGEERREHAVYQTLRNCRSEFSLR